MLAGARHADASANRFGPPWQSRVVVDQTDALYRGRSWLDVVGPLVRGQIVVVTGESTASDGTAWTQMPDGFLLSSDIAEDSTPWVAEVTVPSVSIYARPNTKEPIRRTARKGDLQRVAGVSPGIEGDTGHVVVDDRGLRRPAHACGVEHATGRELEDADRRPMR